MKKKLLYLFFLISVFPSLNQLKAQSIKTYIDNNLILHFAGEKYDCSKENGIDVYYCELYDKESNLIKYKKIAIKQSKDKEYNLLVEELNKAYKKQTSDCTTSDYACLNQALVEYNINLTDKFNALVK